MPKIICVAGQKRSGKDTFAKVLVAEGKLQGKTVEVMSFAEPMKTIIAITLGITLQELEDLKNGPKNPHRGYLQRFGTEGMKPYFGKQVWYNLLLQRIAESSADVVVVPDFRFPEEVIPGALHTKVVRPSLVIDEADQHISERALDDFEFDVVILNDGRLVDLVPHARRILKIIR